MRRRTTISVRAEERADEVRVDEIHAAAFGRRNEADLVALLRGCADPQLSLVAEQEGRVLGHVFFSPVEIGSLEESPPVGGLAPVAVDPAHQGLGIGSALVRSGLERCPELGWKAVFLVGDPNYYSRFGFVLASPMGFDYGSPPLDSVLQVHELGLGMLAGQRGRVRFHPAFEGTGSG